MQIERNQARLKLLRCSLFSTKIVFFFGNTNDVRVFLRNKNQQPGSGKQAKKELRLPLFP